jgi:uncharacterized protein YqeY
MSIVQRITEDIKLAQKEGDKAKLSTLRMLKSELKYREIDKGAVLTEEEEIAVLSTSVKKRLDSIEQFQAGQRTDLVAQEEKELAVVRSYLPEQFTSEQITDLVDASIREVEAKGKSDLGKVMKSLMPKVKGRADGKTVSSIVSSRLEKIGVTS